MHVSSFCFVFFNVKGGMVSSGLPKFPNSFYAVFRNVLWLNKLNWTDFPEFLFIMEMQPVIIVYWTICKEN